MNTEAEIDRQRENRGFKASLPFFKPRNRVTPDNNEDARSDRSTLCGTEGSSKQQHCQMLKLTALTVIPGLILIGRCIASLVTDTEALNANSYIMEQVKLSVTIGDIVHYCQEERGTTALYVSSEGDPLVKELLDQKYKNTDDSINTLSRWIPINEPTHFRSRGQFYEAITSYRDNLQPMNTTLTDVIHFYSDNNRVFIDLIGQSLSPKRSVSYWKDLVAYKLLILSKEQSGVERALGSTFYARGHFPLVDLLWYKDKSTLGNYYLQQALSYSDHLRRLVDLTIHENPLYQQLELMREEISENQPTSPDVVKGTIWFHNMTSYIDILKDLQDEMARKISETAQEENSVYQNLLLASAIQVIAAILVVLLVTVLNRGIVKKIQFYARKLAIRTYELEEEKKRTEMLFYQILPRSIACKLIDKGQVAPESFQSATVMFSDIADFPEITRLCTPLQAVQVLNNIHYIMDNCIDKYDVFRVDNIGGGYMIASGVPRRNGTVHVDEIARLSLNLIAVLKETEFPYLEERVGLRIGFHTGLCSAGVVGHKIPRYCIFGETVDIARKMEITGSCQKIQISDRCARTLETYRTYSIVERGLVNIQGRGAMRTYWLEGLISDE